MHLLATQEIRVLVYIISVRGWPWISPRIILKGSTKRFAAEKNGKGGELFDPGAYGTWMAPCLTEYMIYPNVESSVVDLTN